jgi:hypothetical protein
MMKELDDLMDRLDARGGTGRGFRVAAE